MTLNLYLDIIKGSLNQQKTKILSIKRDVFASSESAEVTSRKIIKILFLESRTMWLYHFPYDVYTCFLLILQATLQELRAFVSRKCLWSLNVEWTILSLILSTHRNFWMKDSWIGKPKVSHIFVSLKIYFVRAYTKRFCEKKTLNPTSWFTPKEPTLWMDGETKSVNLSEEWF